MFYRSGAEGARKKQGFLNDSFVFSIFWGSEKTVSFWGKWYSESGIGIAFARARSRPTEISGTVSEGSDAVALTTIW